MPEKITIGNAELWHGDCREILPTLPVFDLICTDPPYGIGASAGAGKYGRLKIEAGTDLGWDNETPPQWFMLLMLEKAASHVIFGGNYFTLPPSRAYLVWDKGAGFKNRDFAVACAQLGKAFTGIERERKYFDIACERIARAQAQGTLLPPEPPPQPEQTALL